MDTKARLFLDAVSEAAVELVAAGYVREDTATTGEARRRPISVRTSYRNGRSVIVCTLELMHAGEEYLHIDVFHDGSPTFESVTTAHRGGEIRKALRAAFEVATLNTP